MKTECNAVFLFIAELTGSFVPGSGNEQDKIKCGQHDYINSVLPTLDLTDEHDRKGLHEVISLERLYAELDEYFSISSNSMVRALTVNLDKYRTETYKWTVAIELDASASMLQYIGLLLGDERLLEMTNVIGDILEDPWKLDGLTREKLKKAATPMIYGSSQACHELWKDNKIKYTPEDIKLYSKEMAEGAFGIANLLKEFIITNANPEATMKVKIWNEEFDISCNRFRTVGESTKAYKIWDSIDKVYNVLLHTDTTKIPDLEQFRRYFVTLLIHNLDAQVANTVSKKCYKKYGWVIPIHDAFLISPAAAADVRRWYAKELTKLFKDRKQILTDYFKSIGITAAAREQWDTLVTKIHKLEGDIKVNPMALK